MKSIVRHIRPSRNKCIWIVFGEPLNTLGCLVKNRRGATYTRGISNKTHQLDYRIIIVQCIHAPLCCYSLISAIADTPKQKV